MYYIVILYSRKIFMDPLVFIDQNQKTRQALSQIP